MKKISAQILALEHPSVAEHLGVYGQFPEFRPLSTNNTATNSPVANK
jgi:hypothetical protein